jgi:6-pyruvoyltetrahydropterin/6-carboxytetrahydropterin synthase
MLVNISAIKQRVQKILDAHFDHKFLNEDHPAFAKNPPTAENIARQLFLEVTSFFRDSNARLVVCHLIESPEISATVYANGIREINYWLDFSAARQTMSPQLTTKENERLFGLATSVHAHNYRARLTFRHEADEVADPFIRYQEVASCLQSIRAELDHKNLNNQVPGLSHRPITTESLARYIHERTAISLPIHRVRLHEREDFFAEYWNGGRFFLGMQRPFSAAHRLHARSFSDAQNVLLYGKCNNPRGHGHLYLTEMTIGGSYDERSGTLYSFSSLRDGIDEALKPWDNKHLDLETEEFREMPSTGENIVRALWPKVSSRLNEQLVRLRLWETLNNRFTLRTQ